MEWLKNYPQRNKVHYLSPVGGEFAVAYLHVRDSEGRLLTDEMVRNLPELPQTHPLRREWQLRKLSYLKLVSYLKRQHRPLRILDLGCGNGWLAHRICKEIETEVIGMDINVPELEQAARLFASEQCHFVYGDIYQADLPEQYFDIVICNASIQYFEKIPTLLTRLKQIASPGSEWHIIDSPFYAKDELAAARKRTRQYYDQQQVATMSRFYFHHSVSEIKQLGGALLYQPNKLTGRLYNRLGWAHNPFPWIRILL